MMIYRLLKFSLIAAVLMTPLACHREMYTDVGRNPDPDALPKAEPDHLAGDVVRIKALSKIVTTTSGTEYNPAGEIHIIEFRYDDSRLDTISFESSKETSSLTISQEKMGYNKAGQLVQIHHIKTNPGSGKEVNYYTNFARDEVGNLIAITNLKEEIAEKNESFYYGDNKLITISFDIEDEKNSPSSFAITEFNDDGLPMLKKASSILPSLTSSSTSTYSYSDDNLTSLDIEANIGSNTLITINKKKIMTYDETGMIQSAQIEYDFIPQTKCMTIEAVERDNDGNITKEEINEYADDCVDGELLSSKIRFFTYTDTKLDSKPSLPPSSQSNILTTLKDNSLFFIDQQEDLYATIFHDHSDNPYAPTILEPSDNSILENYSPDSEVNWSFKWTEIPDATEYNLKVINLDTGALLLDKYVNEISYEHELSGTISSEAQSLSFCTVSAKIDDRWSSNGRIAIFEIGEVN